MRKGQLNVPLLLLVILGLFILYLLWVNPSERAKILGLNDTVPSDGGSNVSETSKVVFTQSLGYIGRSTGSAVGTHNLGNIDLSYPLINETVHEKSTVVLCERPAERHNHNQHSW